MQVKEPPIVEQKVTDLLTEVPPTSLAVEESLVRY